MRAVFGDTPARQSIPRSVNELCKAAKDALAWTSCCLYVLEPAINPVIGGDPNPPGTPVATMVRVSGPWRQVLGVSDRSGVLLCASSAERLDAMVALATEGASEVDALLDVCNLSDADRLLWAGFRIDNFDRALARAFPLPERNAGTWLIYHVGKAITRHNRGTTLPEACELFLRSLRSNAFRDHSIAVRAANKAKRTDKERAAERTFIGTKVGDALVQAGFDFTQQFIRRRGA